MIRKSQQRNQRQEIFPAKRKYKWNSKSKDQNNIVVSISTLASRNLRRQFLFDLKKSSLVVSKAECDLLNTCKDKVGILFGIGSLNCDIFFIPIHNKCVHEMGWVKVTSLFLFSFMFDKWNPNVDDVNDSDVDIVTI